MGWQNWQLVKRITRQMEMETPTTSSGCETEKGSRLKVNPWKSLKTPAFSFSHQPHPWPVSHHLLFILLPQNLLNEYTDSHPYGNPAVQTTKIPMGYMQPPNWTSCCQYCRQWRAESGLPCPRLYLVLCKCLVNTVDWMQTILHAVAKYGTVITRHPS